MSIDYGVLQGGIKDSGQRQEFKTGAVRDVTKGKGRFDLLPLMTLFRMAKWYEKGCEKYGDRNWEKGIPLSNYMSSCLRHFFKHIMGFKDENHLDAALWNMMCFMEIRMRIDLGLLPQELNDLPYTFSEVEYEAFEKLLDEML